MTTAHSHDEDAKRKEARAFVENLKKIYSDNGYIFRGTTTIHSNEINKIEAGKVIQDGINSTLYRWVVRKDEKEEGAFSDEEHETLRKIFVKNKSFYPATMEKEISENARKMSQSETGAHEILTDLQHFGGKTNMIDFSRNIYVALFFACQGKSEKDGEVIVLHKDKLRKTNTVNYNFPLKEGEVEIIDPAKTNDSYRRADSQESVFLRPVDGYINPDLCDIELIPAYYKKHIMDYLREEQRIDPNTIYKDLHGFIKNQKNNETASLYFYMGWANHKKGEPKNAVSYYGKSINLNANNPAIYNNRALAYCDLGQHELAIEDFSKALLNSPNFVEIYNNRGTVYSNLGKYERAIEDFDKAISISPDYATSYSNRGTAYNSLEQHERAIEDFDKAISINPDFAEAYSNRSIAYNGLKKYECAIKDANKALSFNSNLSEAFFNRGIAHIGLEKHDSVIDDFSKAISINPNYIDAYGFRGITYLKQAISYFQQGISPNHLEKFNRAIDDFSKAISLKPDFAEVYKNRGVCYYNRGIAYLNQIIIADHLEQFNLAIMDFDKAISLNPDYAEVYFYRGVIKHRRGEVISAREDLAKAEKLGFVIPKSLITPLKK